MKPKDLKEKMNNNEDVILFDIREPQEFARGDGIEGSQNVPMMEVLEKAAQGELPKDKKIITICQSGGRCQLIADELHDKGYDIEYLEGGINEWKRTGE